MREGWVETTLGEVATVEMGQSPPGSSYNERGDGLPFIQGSAEFGTSSPRPSKWCDSPQKIARDGDLLISVRAPVGDLNFADSPLAIGRGIAVARGGERASTNFLFHALTFAKPALRRVASGGMFESITKANLSEARLIVPPLCEQRRIVDLMRAVNEYVAAADKRVETAKTARGALLTDLLSREDETWDDTTLGQVASVSSGGTPATTNPGYWKGDIPWISGRTLVSGVVSVSDKSISDAAIGHGGHVVDEETILVLVRGMRLINEMRVGIAGCRVAFNQDIKALTPYESVTPQFLWLSLLDKERELLAQVRRAGHGTGVLETDSLTNLRLKVPQKAEQHQIVQVMKSVAEDVEAAEFVAERSRSARVALLSDLLSGNHGIPASYDHFLEVA